MSAPQDRRTPLYGGLHCNSTYSLHGVLHYASAYSLCSSHLSNANAVYGDLDRSFRIVLRSIK